MRKETEEIFSQRKVDLIHSAYIVHTLYQQQKLGKYCDLKVLVGDKQYFVHRCILAAASAQLDSQINGLDTIQLVGVTYYGFECLLEILYSGKLHDISLLSDTKFQQIVSAADALNAEVVMEYCTRERGDLMNILLSQSNAAKPPIPNEAQSRSETFSQESAGEGKANIANISAPMPKTETETTAAGGNTLPEALNKDIKVENRPYRNDEFGYAEASVAAEVEVDSNQKQNGGKTEDVNNKSQRSDQVPMIENSIPSTCTMCGLVFPNSTELNRHLQTHMMEQLYRCDICGLHFKYEAAMISHRKIHCTCQYCGHECQTILEVQAHHQQVHPEQMIVPQTQFAVDSQQVAPPSQQKSQKRKSGVTPSMTRNKIGGKPAINPVVVNEIMRGENGKYQCPLCDRGFDRRWNLKCHVLIHTAPGDREKKQPAEPRYAETMVTCPECGKIFRNLHNLRRHALSIHGMKAADIEEANESGVTPPTDPTEIVAANSNKKPKKENTEQQATGAAAPFKFWCTICGRGFKRNRNLRGHMETHQNTGLAKYECPVCQRKFSQKESLNGHLWVHKTNNRTEPTGEVPPPQPPPPPPPPAEFNSAQQTGN